MSLDRSVVRPQSSYYLYGDSICVNRRRGVCRLADVYTAVVALKGKISDMVHEGLIALLERFVPRGEGPSLTAEVTQCIIVDGELSALIVEVDFLFTGKLAF